MNPTMDSTPPSRRSEARLRSKSASRLAQSSDDFGENLPCSVTPSPLHLPLQTSNHPLPLQELFIHSPSPVRRSKSRHVERIDAIEEPVDHVGSRRKCKSKTLSMGLMGCGSPKNGRRARRRVEQESREERDLGFGDENGKVRKRRSRTVAATRREKLVPAPSILPSPCLSPKIDDHHHHHSLDGIRQLISELIMWKDVAKSSLWFGFGSLCFLSSCFARGMTFSIISATSQLGLLFLAVAFFYNSFSQRHEDDRRREFKLKEEDIVRATRVMLPAANAAIAMTRELFSGEPSMTLKMAPVLVLASEYGHLMTLWRLSAIGFFVSFTIPKLYSRYSLQIHRQVDYLRSRVGDAWAACAHKRIVAASAATVFWNLSTIKTRIFAAFISVVVIRCYQQHQPDEAEVEAEQQLAMVVLEGRHKEAQQLEMVVAEGPSDGSSPRKEQ
ncbi:reticulon-like protein B17 [Magnolia sinica]|uniref:reticulon-like protein B17 n=1 Tax=Magnolia sinica TaxID=86752 RepID=UPI00265B0D83|nr:reticulon-like protein B17 [Magnolia sinica]